jgi:hypothetical protein
VQILPNLFKNNLKLYIIKYMVSNRCKMAVKEELKNRLHFIVVDLGEVDVMENNYRSAPTA